MPNVSLSSFLKILSKGTPQKVQEYGKYLTPGGYDFYWRLKDAARALTVEGKSFAECVKPIEAISRAVEKAHNLEGLKSLQRWLEVAAAATFFRPPAANCSSPEGLMNVKLEPEFGIVIDGHRRLVQIWNSKGGTLNRTIAGAGIYLIQEYLCRAEFGDCEGAVLDLRKRELYLAAAIPPNIPMIVASELAWVDGFFKAHKKAA